MDEVCEHIAAGACTGRPGCLACETKAARPLGPELSLPRGPWGGGPSCDAWTSALGSRSVS